MFMNVFNSCNRDVIHGFAEKFIRNDAQFILEAPSKSKYSSDVLMIILIVRFN